MEKYTKIMEIGRGSYGVVWKAMNKQTGEVVAIKKLNNEYKTNEDSMNLREVKSLIKIVNHPNIVKLKEIIRENNTLFLIFEYMECDLYQLMVERTKPFTESEIRNMCFQILQGLAYMHHKGYMHRDLKPENILVSKNILKIGDLGSARETNGEQPYTHYNVTTLCYRAPEVFLRSPCYNSSVDMWAFGAIMAELYTTQAVFDGSSDADVMQKICGVLGTPTESTWLSGLDLARNVLYRFPDFPGMRFSELLPTASSDAVNLVASLLSWCPSDRPTAMEALQHPFFHGCYCVPPTIRLEDTFLNSVPLVFKMAKQRELLKEKRSLTSCGSGLEKLDSNEDQILMLQSINFFDFME
ncbi:putative protein-serine/threonine kinase CMGC-RCK family [Helianthus annuus]|uniref:Putative serine/threonine/dual specificity protein kinase, catalytic domain-containing protein n=1 Tax=Helianthus annuus TaxID=4232 RepID=A0A251VM88_HELAN|nr:cyclin-dependent kinase F-4 [Helianthus annuus]KAF5821455.1 putative protein-serine/threonine kinase CMGC-RCK family [Helianthus annuus]KAJ0611127.1 putative protein-serine/threonine kinase CMGC-RCK family [Helianthus annuus]KAJ0622072.1 putative protein-serine/threonine kinase CMGC-RCK family [Helianthus annuus]KAJ0626398.1 putative protein-serine/threonine kinase CMGC-RCK family [Helianthus annuus]KAJ0782741.1 putative protein-serine/threonine kinase CMGC-RCK family [Helianthus annuus]